MVELEAQFIGIDEVTKGAHGGSKGCHQWRFSSRALWERKRMARRRLPKGKNKRRLSGTDSRA
jgi:hypothetical protein